MALQAGFVGCGNITDTHARAAREAGLGIAAFHGRDLAKAEALAARFGGRAFARYEDFLAHRPMDLVVIGSPSALHAEQGIAAAERSLHVLVEKPIDVTLAKGQAFVAAAERAGVRLGVLFQDRLKPELVRLRRVRRAGRPRAGAARLGARQVAPPARVLLGLALARPHRRSTAAPRSSTRASTQSTCCCGCSGT